MTDPLWNVVKPLPTDYQDYGGTVKRWAQQDQAYPDCSSGCIHWRPLHNVSTNGADGDWGVCAKWNGPRAGLLTWEQQAGYTCCETATAATTAAVLPVYTVHAEYNATGEGQTYMIMITNAMPFGDRSEDTSLDATWWAKKHFEYQFGSFMARGADVKPGLYWDFAGCDLLVSDTLRNNIERAVSLAGGVEYHASYHANYS